MMMGEKMGKQKRDDRWEGSYCLADRMELGKSRSTWRQDQVHVFANPPALQTARQEQCVVQSISTGRTNCGVLRWKSNENRGERFGSNGGKGVPLYAPANCTSSFKTLDKENDIQRMLQLQQRIGLSGSDAGIKYSSRSEQVIIITSELVCQRPARFVLTQFCSVEMLTLFVVRLTVPSDGRRFVVQNRVFDCRYSKEQLGRYNF